MRIVLLGYGRMGRMIEELALSRGHEIAARIDKGCEGELMSLPAADVAMDFSSPDMMDTAAEYIMRTGTPLLSGTTGGDGEYIKLLRRLGGYAPVLHSANYSLGIALLKRLLPIAADTLKGFDIEIVETHHRMKADAPSGTAKLLADAIDPDNIRGRVYGREGCTQRGGEIGIHALRGGTVAGEHSVLFFGEDESLTLTHSASSRRVFAAGALTAAEKLTLLDNGFYTLDDVLFYGEKE